MNNSNNDEMRKIRTAFNMIEFPPALAIIESCLFILLGTTFFTTTTLDNPIYTSKHSSSLSVMFAFSLPYLSLINQCVISSCHHHHQKKKSSNQLHQQNIKKYAGDKDGIVVGASLLPLFLFAGKTLQQQQTDKQRIEYDNYDGMSSLLEIYCMCCCLSSFAFLLSTLLSARYAYTPQKQHHSQTRILFVQCLLFLLINISSKQTITTTCCTLYLIFYIFGLKMQYNKTSTLSSTSSSNLSVGEWNLLISSISLLFTDFIMRYCTILSQKRTQQQQQEREIMTILPPDYITVSHSGIVGCILGCVSFSSLLPSSIALINVVCRIFNKNVRLQINETKKKVRLSLYLSLHVLVVAIAALGCVEIALCSIGYNMGSTLDTMNNDKEESSFIRIPRCINWIVRFLLASSSYSVYNNTFEFLPNGIWLLYWAFLLACVFPIAIAISSNDTDNGSNKSSSSIVISRKFFHFVAIALFLPCTMYDSPMMCLSYAVATCVLILLESIRLAYLNYNNELMEHKKKKNDDVDHVQLQQQQTTVRTKTAGSSSPIIDQINHFYVSFLDEKENESDFLMTHVSLVAGCGLPLWLKHSLFSSSLNNNYSGIEGDHLKMMMMIIEEFLLPYFGLIVLGVGDAAGAIIGTLHGKTKWTRLSKRSVEGSVGMFVSMLLSSLLLIGVLLLLLPLPELPSHEELMNLAKNENWLWLIPSISYFLSSPLLICTVFEACTAQIDNICLPLVGCISIIATELLLRRTLE